MERAKYLANRLREVLLDGHWIANTNYKEQLKSTGWEHALYKVVNLNTIAALTYHINYYIAGLLDVFDGKPLTIRDKFSFDVPTIQSEDDWQKMVSNFLSNAERFANEIEKMPDQKLDEAFVDEKYGSYLRNIEGVIEHSYYHLGQVSLLRKMIGASTTK